MDATHTITTIDTFNDHLARAKLAALQLLQDIMNSLLDPDPPIPKRFRELRLIAAAILRTQPMKSAPASDPSPRVPSQSRSSSPSSPPSPPRLCDEEAPSPSDSPASPSLSPSPKPRRFHPSSEWARAAARSLIKNGHLPKNFLDDLPPDPAADHVLPPSARHHPPPSPSVSL